MTKHSSGPEAMASRPIVFFQTRATQVDAPFFRSLASLGVELSVVFRQTDEPFDPELALTPNFGNVDSGYAWSVRNHRLPRNAHVVVEGWSHLWCWRVMARVRARRDLTLGLRFDTVSRDRVGGLMGLAGSARVRSALEVADVWHPAGSASLRFANSCVKSPKPSVPIPYSVDESLFVRQESRRFARARELELLVVSKLTDREAVADVISAMRGMVGWRLTVVGDGPCRADLEQLAGSLDVNVRFVGYVKYESLPNYYHEADVFVHPARIEPWGVSVQEAMFAGLPVLASNRVGAAAELLPMPVDEWRFPVGDAHSLETLIAKMSDPDRRRRHSESNLIAARQHSSQVASRNLADSLLLDLGHRA